ncbi:type IV pilin protein [Eikenella sp. S3360]|uniref:Type IV pilin protein n=1 Tax=Eikenella glucosivorans TaxID=2766967 RepID=A0ABS0NCG8_9NEIS|nr:type IV pilin protein [Eikenella glucosivorans]MBH5330015.1 type IV pilin protein [Eikenella glucosivorans]
MNGLSIRIERGFTLIELLVIIAIVAVLAVIAYPSYQSFVRKSRLEEANAALLENSRAMERFYTRNRTFKANSTSWPAIPVTQTAHFCIKFQGNARGVLGDKYTIKAVAFDVNKEPRVLLINQDQTVRICESSSSRCDNQTVFPGGNNIDKNCELLH